MGLVPGQVLEREEVLGGATAARARWHTEWVVLLLKRTKYATLPEIFTHRWWLSDTTPESKPDRVKAAVKVVEGLLQKLDPKDLPKAVAPVWPTTIAEQRQLILKLSGPGPDPLRRTKP